MRGKGFGVCGNGEVPIGVVRWYCPVEITAALNLLVPETIFYVKQKSEIKLVDHNLNIKYIRMLKHCQMVFYFF